MPSDNVHIEIDEGGMTHRIKLLKVGGRLIMTKDDERQKALETAREWLQQQSNRTDPFSPSHCSADVDVKALTELILSVERKAKVEALEWAIRQHICGQDAVKLAREITRLRAEEAGVSWESDGS